MTIKSVHCTSIKDGTEVGTWNDTDYRTGGVNACVCVSQVLWKEYKCKLGRTFYSGG